VVEAPGGSEGERAGFSVYDMRGRWIREVDAGRLRAGHASLVWDRKDDEGREVGAGVYFLRFRVGRPFPETRKVVLLPRGS
jgi:flagellar hook assembly protein FlgD